MKNYDKRTKRIIDMKDLSLTTLSLLTIVFITLKLTSVITWSWWWVLSPMIAELSIYAAGIIVGIVILLPKKKKSEKPTKSRYQERLEEMQKRQEEISKRNNLN